MKYKTDNATGIDIRYSDTLEANNLCYHDFRYTNDNYGGNQNQTTLEIENNGGNYLKVEMVDTEGNAYAVDLDKIKITLSGSIENNDFLQALRLIMETEKIIDLFNGGSHAIQEQSRP
jgi:hypothetical protein